MKKLFGVLLILLTGAGVQAQKDPPKRATPFVLGEVNDLYSPALNEHRALNVYLPEGYANDSIRSYPVIYLLDGSADEDFIHIAGLVQFCNMIGAMPGTIVVGIGNVDRKRDFTYPSGVAADKKLVPASGGSAAFMDFLEQDLQPYILRQYKAGGTRTIIGQSLGGLLATEILLKRPSLFDNYIIISPSLWWDEEGLLAKAPTLLKAQPDGRHKVYLSVGTEGKQMEADAKRLAVLLQQQKQRHPIKMIFAPLPKESHLTILHQSIYNAFRAKAAE